MNILFVCHRFPYPPNRGGKIRPFNMIRYLSEKHSVTVASLAHTADEMQAGAGLKDHCAEVIAEVLPETQRRWQALRALPTHLPSSVAYFQSDPLHRRIAELASRKRFDLVWVHCAFVAQYVLNIQAGGRIMDFGDLDSGKWAAYAQWKSAPLSWMYRFESAKLRRYEQSIANHFHHCTVTTNGEREELTRLSSASCTVIPNGVDLTYFSPGKSGKTTRSVIVFLGRMDYFPNIDAVCYFAETILPLIRQNVPDVEFRVVGSNPSRKIQNLPRRIPGVVVTGHVPDVRDYVQDVALGVAPLRIARGTQNKILELMAMGIPVVATYQAAKGIQAVPGRDLLVEDSPEMFAAQVTSLLRDARLRQSMQEAGRRQVEQAHRWAATLSILDSTLAEVRNAARLSRAEIPHAQAWSG